MARRRESAWSGADLRSYCSPNLPTKESEESRARARYATAGPAPTVAHSETRPETEMQALMECAPHQEPDVPRDKLLPLRDILQDAIDTLDEREEWVFDALFTRRLSIRQCAAELGLNKDFILRLRDKIIIKLRGELAERPEIQEWLI